MAQNPVITAARRRFREADIPFPPIPRDLASGVRELGKWEWGTEEAGWGLYAFYPFVNGEAGTPPFLFLGHGGHGINSYAFQYFLLKPPLELFLQMPFGGVLQDTDHERRAIDGIFWQVQNLLHLVEYQSKTASDNSRIRVVASGLTRQREVTLESCTRLAMQSATELAATVGRYEGQMVHR